MHARCLAAFTCLVLLVLAAPAFAQRGPTIDDIEGRIEGDLENDLRLTLMDGRERKIERELPPREQWPPAPVARTGQTKTYVIGDDGYHQRGVPWPNPRFTDNDNGTITDNLTGLIWLKRASADRGVVEWAEAIRICNEEIHDGEVELTDGSKPGDWRLSNLREVGSLFDYSQSRPALPADHPFERVLLASHFASNTHPTNPRAGFRYATQSGALAGYSGKVTGHDPIWPVRGGYDGPPAPATQPAAASTDDKPAYTGHDVNGPLSPVLKTGQTECYQEGDDGDHQRGYPLTFTADLPRFTDSDDGTIADHLTGLVWLKATAAKREPMMWAAAVEWANELSDGKAGLSDHSKPGDWRLPNVRELHSLIDYSENDPALPAKHPFSGIPSELHWTSTTSGANIEDAFSLNILEGRIWTKNKQHKQRVWAVKGGL